MNYIGKLTWKTLHSQKGLWGFRGMMTPKTDASWKQRCRGAKIHTNHNCSAWTMLSWSCSLALTPSWASKCKWARGGATKTTGSLIQSPLANQRLVDFPQRDIYRVSSQGKGTAAEVAPLLPCMYRQWYILPTQTRPCKFGMLCCTNYSHVERIILLAGFNCWGRNTRPPRFNQTHPVSDSSHHWLQQRKISRLLQKSDVPLNPHITSHLNFQ